MRFIVLLIALLALSSCTTTALQAVPKFSIDLDQPPLERWNGAVDMLVELYGWNYTFGPMLDMYTPILALIPQSMITALDKNLANNFADVHGELQGIGWQLAKYGCAICNTTAMSIFAYDYEVSHVSLFQHLIPKSMFRSCTGILSLPSNKSAAMIHGRNMDEDPHQARNITLDVSVMKGGVLQFQIVDWSWVSGGFATSSRLNGLTMEMNWNTDGPSLSLEEVYDRILQPGTIPVLLLFRVVNDKNLDFEQALSFINTTSFASPFYNIISGTGRRGAVLTIQFNQSRNVIEVLDDSSNVTFMVQTNYDRWLPDPPSDPRRTVAQNAMTLVGRERSGTELGVWMALSTYPVHNPSTMFTALMSVDRAPEAYVRTAMNLHQYNN